MIKGGLSKLFFGAGIGFGAGLIVAAKSSDDAINIVKDKLNEVELKLKNIKYSSVKDNIALKLDEIKSKVSELANGETKDVIKGKVSEIKGKLDYLAKYVKTKSEPVFKKVVNDINEKLDAL